MISMVVPRILVTDDDRAIRRAVEDVFRGHGLHVETASDGDEAISMLHHGDVHVLVIDVHMPRVSGLEVMRHMRSQNMMMPCILMSAALTDLIQQEAEAMRAYRVLAKPLRVSTLRETVIQGLREVYGWKVG